MTAIEVNACWVESIKKESKGRVLHENFDFNPKNLVILTDKPNVSKETYYGISANPEETVKELEELKIKLETLTSVPKKKYNFPLTSN